MKGLGSLKFRGAKLGSVGLGVKDFWRSNFP